MCECVCACLLVMYKCVCIFCLGSYEEKKRIFKSLNNKPAHLWIGLYLLTLRHTVCIWVGNLLNTDVSVMLSLVLKHLPRKSDSCERHTYYDCDIQRVLIKVFFYLICLRVIRLHLPIFFQFLFSCNFFCDSVAI